MCAGEHDKARHLNGLLASSEGLHVRPHVFNCTKKNHVVDVHQSHIAVLQECARRRWEPCVVLESDATWKGDLYSALVNAATENALEPWDLIVMGITPEDVVQLPKNQFKARKSSLRLSGTGGGCHAYLVRNPSEFAKFMQQRTIMSPFRGRAAPCIEYIHSHHVHIVLETEVPVYQTGKRDREGRRWAIDHNAVVMPPR